MNRNMPYGWLCRLLLLPLSVLLDCGNSASPLEPLRDATLTPGVGLGTLELDKTTLREVLASMGRGTPILVVSDETAIELDYANRQLALLFPLTRLCMDNIRDMALRQIVPNLEAWVNSHPSCGDITLTSLAVATREGFGSTWFRGKTNKGIGLGQSLKEVIVAYEPPDDAHGRLLAGLGPLTDIGLWEYPSGIQFYFSPEKTNKLEEATIVHMTIFRPEPKRES
ncbi:hypothetical protein [Candidatus Nitrospira inopinata]|nr:hypothetical protein [Candidatus Nitrospira inopinata]